MKRIILFLCIMFAYHIPANAQLGDEKEYWIEEITKNNGRLDDNMIMKQFHTSNESYAYNVYGGSESDIESWKSITLVIAGIIKNNSVLLKNLIITGFNDRNFNEFYNNTMLDAINYNKTIEFFRCSRVSANGASKVANIIKNNKTIKSMEFEDSYFDDQGALAIAQALKVNTTVQSLEFTNSKFSMLARKAMQDAWAQNKVDGRREQISF